ncbi:replication initiation protein [Cohnella sp. CFH 77786]|uniref:replication initiation protein n=1 Tax=Cohnella sp. CFH 77786 TaxID=2662265 RepID=UPI001C60BA23|nr:replication initiation protein [Cohnella sp. CFH 77786]
MSQLLQVSQNLIQPKTRSEAFFGLLFGENMNSYPKRSGMKTNAGKRDSERQWVFVGTKERMKSMATQATLYAVLADPAVDTSFYTPNGYYRRDLRWTESLRWLNALTFDFDNYGESIEEVIERIDRAGLPRPTAIVRTPSGGHHASFFFTEPVRATDKAIRLYSAIMWHMADDLGADMAAVGANRIFRTPTEQNMLYFEPANRYSFDVFKDWREINHPYDPDAGGFVNVHTGNLMSHPALQYLLTAPCDYGNRDVVAFNLALAMKASDWTQEQAETAMRDWFIYCCAKGAQAGKKPFTQRDAVYKASYVFRSSKLQAPKAEIIREITGMPFYYRTRNHWEPAKPRSERERSHLHEWEADLLDLLQSEKELSGTQQELATRLHCPLTSFKAVLGQLKDAGKVIVETRRGRGGVTVIRPSEAPEAAAEASNVIPFPIEDKNENGPSAPVENGVVVYADFRERKIERIERFSEVKIEPEPPDPGPPD